MDRVYNDYAGFCDPGPGDVMRIIFIFFLLTNLIYLQDDPTVTDYNADEKKIQALEDAQITPKLVAEDSVTTALQDNPVLAQGEEPAVFVPLTADQQAAMNPKNAIIQNAYFWNKWRYKKSNISKEPDVSRANSVIMEEKEAFEVTDSVSTDSTVKDSLNVAEKSKPKEIIAIIQENAPGLKSDSIIIKEKKRQRLLKGKGGAIRYYKKWNVFKGILREPIPYSRAISNFYKVSFDKEGLLKSVTEYRIRSKPVKTTTFVRDSLGLYTTYIETYHLRTSLIENDPNLYAYDVSELRPGWTAVYTMDVGHQTIDHVKVYDQYGIIMYRYKFHYTSGKAAGNRNYSRVTTVEYFSADGLLIGWHRLWYRGKRNLSLIEYFDAKDTLLSTKEFEYHPAEKELLITLRDPDGVILDRRLKPVF